ncbi:DUF4118 domain-containing protein [Paraherbaspirillum soli]|uniref:DUF4118 domain-containing protein n=1 Tax=Paraherbaspirillum soli TaxID=631222 RepID=A0ABW0M8R5_9BURK
MKLRNARNWKQSGIRPFVICLFNFAIAFGLGFILIPMLDEYLFMLFFTINCIAIAYLFGFQYSIGVFLLSMPTAFYFFRRPFYSFESLDHQDIYIIVAYTTIIVLASWIVEWLQRERYTAVLLQRVSESRYQLLIESDQARRIEYAKHVQKETKAAD